MKNKPEDKFFEIIGKIEKRLEVLECSHSATKFVIYTNSPTIYYEECLICGKRLRTFPTYGDLLEAERQSLQSDLEKVNLCIEVEGRGIK